MKIIGIVLLWSGFIAGSLTTVLNSEAKGVKFVKDLTAENARDGRFELPDLTAVKVPDDGWHLIPWNWYIPAALVCLAGAVLIQLSKRSHGQKSETTEAGLEEIQSALNRIVKNTTLLFDNAPKLAPSKIVARIDNELADDLRVFADGRESIIAEYGLSCFADVMTNFSAGERSINRAWSAAADGYIDEAADCIGRACKLMQEALNELGQANEA